MAGVRQKHTNSACAPKHSQPRKPSNLVFAFKPGSYSQGQTPMRREVEGPASGEHSGLGSGSGLQVVGLQPAHLAAVPVCTHVHMTELANRRAGIDRQLTSSTSRKLENRQTSTTNKTSHVDCHAATLLLPFHYKSQGILLAVVLVMPRYPEASGEMRFHEMPANKGGQVSLWSFTYRSFCVTRVLENSRRCFSLVANC